MTETTLFNTNNPLGAVVPTNISNVIQLNMRQAINPLNNGGTTELQPVFLLNGYRLYRRGI